MNRILFVIALLVFALSCSGSPKDSMSAHNVAPIDPCKLLTQDEAAAALGEPLGIVKREDNNPDLLCSYTNSANAHSVSITSLNGKGAKKEFTTAQDLVAHDMTVDNLGDAAFISKTRAIHVLVGDAYFAIKLKDDSPLALPKQEGVQQPAGATELPQATRDKLIALARQAISRL